MRLSRSIPVATLVLLLASGALAASPAPPEGPLTELCREADVPAEAGGEKLCDTVRVTTWGAADGCRDLGADNAVCTVGDGRDVGEHRIAAHEDSALHRVLVSQRRLGQPLPLVDAQVLSTHNSYNSYAYRPTPSRMDANQTYSLRDQLRMDVRRLELDVHWWVDTDPTDGVDEREPVLCHGTGSHAGCSFEIPLAAGLAEIDTWLDDNPDEVIMLRFETHLDGAEGRADAAADIEAVLGDHLHRPPPGDGCTTLDLDLTFAQVREADRQVIAVGDCAAGGTYPDLVWDDDPVRVESSYGGQSFDAAAGECHRDRPTYDTQWVRYWDDATWVSSMAAAPGEEPVPASPEVVTEWMRCGVNQPGFDHLTPGDERLAATVWSWAEDEVDPDAGEHCVTHGPDGRFHSEDCGSASLLHACSAADGTWRISGHAGPWGSGGAACASVGASFDVPRTGWASELLRRAKARAGVDVVWLAYHWRGGGWAVP